MIRQAKSWLMPVFSRPMATSGPATRPSPCIEKTSATIRPRSWRDAHSLMIVELTG
jgi:hypothetical protein